MNEKLTPIGAREAMKLLASGRLEEASRLARIAVQQIPDDWYMLIMS